MSRGSRLGENVTINCHQQTVELLRQRSHLCTEDGSGTMEAVLMESVTRTQGVSGVFAWQWLSGTKSVGVLPPLPIQ